MNGNPLMERTVKAGIKERNELERHGSVADSPAVDPAQLEQMYSRPAATSAQMKRMTYDDVLIKTASSFAFVVLGAVVGWNAPALALPAVLVGLVLGLVNSFKKEPSAVLVLAYAAVEGIFVGAISKVFDAQFDGIVMQAVLGTLAVFGSCLFLFSFAGVRATAKGTKILLVAMLGYLVFSIVNFGLTAFGAMPGFGLRSEVKVFGIPLGVIIGLVAVGMAAYTLILDLTAVEYGVKNGIAAKYSWQAAFSLTATLIWLYVEILRILAILAGNRD